MVLLIELPTVLFSWADKQKRKEDQCTKQKYPFSVYPLIEHAVNRLLDVNTHRQPHSYCYVLVIRIRRANRYTLPFDKRNQQAGSLDFLELGRPILLLWKLWSDQSKGRKSWPCGLNASLFTHLKMASILVSLQYLKLPKITETRFQAHTVPFAPTLTVHIIKG